MNDPLIPPRKPDRPVRDLPARARYEVVKRSLDLKWRRREPQPERMMREIVDGLWDAFSELPWKWCGFWILRPDGQGLLPGPGRLDAPAARALDGLPAAAMAGSDSKCGEDGGLQAVAVPVFDKNGKTWAVFVARASEPFAEVDTRWLEQIVKAFRTYTRPDFPPL